MPIVHVKGYGYGDAKLYDFKVVFYDYGPSHAPISYSLIDLGNDGSPKYLAKDASNYINVCFGQTGDVHYYYRFTVDCITTRQENDYSQGWGMYQTKVANFGFASTGIYALSSPVNFNVANNFVGIGKTNPSAKLDVVGNIYLSANIVGNDGTRGYLLSKDSLAGGRSYLILDPDAADGVGVGSDYLYIAQENTTGVISNTTAGPLLLNPGGGNVGVGTDSAVAQFHIGGTASNNNPWMVLDVNDTFFKRIIFSEERPAYGITGYGGYLGYDAAANTISLGTYHDTGEYRALNILRQNGYIGIGTTNPSSSLTIYDHTNGATLNLVGRASDDTAVINFRTSGDLSTYAYVAPDTNEFRTYHNDGFMSFYPGGSEKVRFTAAGNVGIGITNPSNKIQISGGGISFTTSTGLAVPMLGLTAINVAYIGPYATSTDGNAPTLVVLNQGASVQQTYFYSSGRIAMVLNKEGRLNIAGNAGNTPPALLNVGPTSSVDAVSGMSFGNDSSANLYRSAASTIKTDGSLEVVANLNVGADLYVADELGVGVPIASKRFNYGAEIGAASASIQLVLGRLSSATGQGGIGADASNTFAVWNVSGQTTKQFVITQQGNIGIGSETPTQKLDVSGTLKIKSAGTYSDPADNAAFLNYDTVGGIFTLSARSNAGNTYMAFRTSNGGTGSEKVRITNNGLVGISSNAPTDFLDFGGAGKNIVFGYAAYGEILNSAASIVGNNVKASPTANSQVRRFASTNDQGNFIKLIYNKGVTFHTNIISALNTDISEDTNERMRINLSGDVGIGGINPIYRLQLQANNPTNGVLAQFYNFNAGAAGANGAFTIWTQYGIADWFIGQPSGVNALTFGRDKTSSATGVEYMRINSAGNVGVGTISPAASLHIKPNTISANTFIIERYASTAKLIYAYESGADGYLEVRNGSDQAVSRIAGYPTTPTYFQSSVGVGTTSPSVKLAVNGEASFGDGGKLTLIGLDINSGATPSFIKIRTKIPFASAAADFTINIKGFRYNSAETTNLSICWHYYNSTFYNPAISSAGSFAPTVKLSAEDWDSSGTPKVCIVLVGPGYYPKLYVESMYSSSYNDDYADGWDWVDADATGTGNNLAILAYKSNFGNNFLMLNNGYVGIGSANPTQRLDVGGYVMAGEGLYRTSTYGTNGGAWVSFGDTGVLDSLGRIGAYSALFNINSINGDTSFQYNGSEKMRITTAGNVGIGVTNPGVRLQVVNTDSITSTSTVRIIGATGNGGGSQIEFFKGTSQKFSIGTASAITGGFSDDLLITTLNPSSIILTAGLSGLAVFKTDGKVGIGMYNPITLLSVGSAGSTTAASGLTFGADAQVNLYRSAENVLKTDGSLIITDSLGVGLSPTQKLQVDGVVGNPALNGTSQSGIFRISNTTDNAVLDFGIRAGGSGAWIQSTDETSLDAYYPLLLNPNGGNVGIGTITANHKLDLNIGTISTNPTTFGYNVFGNATSNVGYCGYNLQLNNSTANATAYLRLARTSATAYLGLEIASQSRDGIRFLTHATAPVEVARITNEGNVGIGTTSPIERLHVSGNIHVQAESNSIGGNGIYLGGATTRFLAVRQTSTNKDFAFDTYNNTESWVNRLTILNNGGNVGIGTTIPSYKLEVRNDSAETVAQFRGLNDTTIIIGGNDAGRNGEQYITYQNADTAGNAWMVGMDDSEDFRFAYGTAGEIADSNTKVKIGQNGNVGIGQTNPLEKLQVQGNIYATDAALFNFKAQRIPLEGNPQGGTYKGYLILAKAFTSGLVEASYVIGKVILRRGTSGTGHNLDIYEVNSSRGYNAETFQVSRLGTIATRFLRLVKVTYGGVVYHAIETSSGGGAPSTEMYFEGSSTYS
jgi:hypothetical protein